MADRYLFMMSRIQNRIMGHFKRELKKEGLASSPGEMGILLALETLEPPSLTISMGELSHVLDMDRAALTRLVNGLEKQGLVFRQINPDNRRQVQLSIAPRGVDRAVKIKKIARQANRKIREGFSPEEMAVYMRVNRAILEKF